VSLFSALNARILAALDRRTNETPVAAVAVMDGLLVLTDEKGVRHTVPWRNLQTVAALRRECYAGDEVVLLLAFSGPQLCEVPASCRGWAELCDAVGALPGARPFGEWHARVLGADFGSAEQVWSADGTPAASVHQPG
jgi:hypothetical protein